MICVIWHSWGGSSSYLAILMPSSWPSNVVNPKPHAGDISGKIGDGFLDSAHWLSWGTTGIFWLWEYYGFTIRNKQLDLPVDDWAIGKSTIMATCCMICMTAWGKLPRCTSEVFHRSWYFWFCRSVLPMSAASYVTPLMLMFVRITFERYW